VSGGIDTVGRWRGQKEEIKEEIKEEPVDNGIKAAGKRKAYQGAQARNKARKLR
jgi:hypothetical protein